MYLTWRAQLFFRLDIPHEVYDDREPCRSQSNFLMQTELCSHSLEENQYNVINHFRILRKKNNVVIWTFKMCSEIVDLFLSTIFKNFTSWGKNPKGVILNDDYLLLSSWRNMSALHQRHISTLDDSMLPFIQRQRQRALEAILATLYLL